MAKTRLTGPALDALVAEKVFGWSNVSLQTWLGQPGPSRVLAAIPNYQSYTGMGLVLDEMERRGWPCQVGRYGQTVDAFFWAPFAEGPDHSGPWIERHAANAATRWHAVIYAALSALGVAIPEVDDA